MPRDAGYYIHHATGVLVYDYGEDTRLFVPWWAIVVCDQGVVDLYAWLSRRHGIPIQKGSAYGPHISFIKGEEPPDKSLWGKGRTVEFWYSNVVRRDNNCHAWLDCWSDDLIKTRAALGLLPKVKMSYHMTLGRLA